MTWAVVVKTGDNVNPTLSSIYFDKWGSRTGQKVILCDRWIDGYLQVKSQGYQSALFIDSGTVFLDWPSWKSMLDCYPHQGIIGHVIWHPDDHPHLHPQCWFIDIKKFQFECDSELTYPMPIRSERNIHDDYTPLWIRPGQKTITHTFTNFGQQFIAQQLSAGLSVVNWNESARSLKFYIYDQSTPWPSEILEYKNLAESQLWILNNEFTSEISAPKLLCPGSGTFWIRNIISPAVKEIKIIDISQTQIDFCRALWNDWDGNDYGRFVWNFIKTHKLTHWQLDRTDFTDVERLKLRNPTIFVDYVNKRFNQIIGDDSASFKDAWNQAKQQKKLQADQGNLIDWVITNQGLCGYDCLWASNILDYKWTMLYNSAEKYSKFKALIE